MQVRSGLVAALACAGAMAAGCASSQGQQGADAPPAPVDLPGQAASSPPDPWVVMIGAERWGVMIDRAREGARVAPAGGGVRDESEALRADRALKSGAAELILLRNDLCSRGVMAADACGLGDWPDWVLEPPTDATPMEVLERRSQWLGEAIQPFVARGCELGRAASGEEMFCSVE